MGIMTVVICLLLNQSSCFGLCACSRKKKESCGSSDSTVSEYKMVIKTYKEEHKSS